MAEIKKVIIPKAQLKNFSGASGSYKVKYRIITDDNNRVSHWSPVYNIPVNLKKDPITDTVIGLNVSFTAQIPSDPVQQKTISAVWSKDINGIETFDIYLKYNGETGWKFVRSIFGNEFRAIPDTGKTSVMLAIQASTFPKTRYPSATLFESTTALSLV
jgi:hypothetical protein